MDEPRFSSARVGHHADDLAAAFAHARERLAQQRELAVAADERAQPPLFANFEPRAPTSPDNAMNANRLLEALHFHPSEELAADVSLHETVRCLTDQDRSGLGAALQPRRQIGGVPDRGVVHPQVVPDATDNNEPGVEPEAHPDLDTVPAALLLGQSRHRLPDGQRCLHGALCVFLDAERRTEQRHHSVAKELVHRAFVTVDGFRHEPKDAVHELVHGFRIEALGKTSRFDDVAEEDRNLLALAFERGFGRQNAVGEVLRSVVVC
ncbi:MAG TPA: hypothetical protein VGL09_16130 [Methylomirabilota bacterium]